MRLAPVLAGCAFVLVALSAQAAAPDATASATRIGNPDTQSAAQSDTQRTPPAPIQALWTAADADVAAPRAPKFDWSAEIEARKSYGLPVAEIVGFDVLLNRFNYAREGGGDYRVSARTVRDNLRHRWVVDNDPYSVNQFLHPYQGSMYHGFARSAGLTYWEALGYTFAGSAFWEIFGENTPPSRNDQIASGIAGTFLGEALFRMANLVLERDDGLPQWAHELGAAAISPPVGFNRLVFGERFKTPFPSHDPEYYSRLSLGVTTTTTNDPGVAAAPKRNEVSADFAMDYGLPGNPDYTYKRPFDYFVIKATAASGNGVENILTRGLLVGRDYQAGPNYRGIWGLYGSYDYIAPQIFRISSTALSLGTTGQYWLSDNIALQGTGMFGVGYAAVGTLHGTEQDPAKARDYHYGVAPQALLSLRMIFGDKYSLDLTGREYFVSKLGAAAGTGGNDNIARLDSALTWRISGKHALSLRYILSRRDATYLGTSDRSQTRGTIGLYYTLLGHDRFGAVDWRR